MFEAGQQLLEDFARVADESGVDFDVFVDFRAVDFDVNLARFLCVRAEIAGNAIVKAHSNSDQQIRFLDCVIDPGFAVHAHHAEIERIAGREAANAEERHGYWEIPGVHELVEHAHRAGDHDSVPREDQGPLGGVEQVNRALKFRLVVIDALALGRKLWRGSVPVEIARGLLRSEERRVGKECRSRWSTYHYKKKIYSIYTAAVRS